MNYNNIKISLLILTFLGLYSCKEDVSFDNRPDSNGENDTIVSTINEIKKPLPFMPPPLINPNNPPTVEGLRLGKKLFYDKMLSGNNAQNCASCHHPSAAFSDPGKKVSVGSTGALGTINSMPLFNLAYSDRFFWDGRTETLEDQIIFPITADFEMNQDPEELIDELKNHPKYLELFRKAFPNESDININSVQKALAQFLRTMYSFTDVIDAGQRARYSEQIQRGFEVYIDEDKGDCFHCHTNTPLISNYRFVNNGLNADPSKDPGLGAVTGRARDMGKFKTPSLINIKDRAPYMHDGRFATLEEVLDFYDTGFHYSASLHPDLKKHVDTTGSLKPVPRSWTKQDKEDLLAFLNAMVDTVYITDPYYLPDPE